MDSAHRVESSDSPIFRGPFDLSCSLGGSQLEQELNHLNQFPFHHRSVEEEIGASGDARGAFQGKVTRHEKYDGQFPMGNRGPDGTAKVKGTSEDRAVRRLNLCDSRTGYQ